MPAGRYPTTKRECVWSVTSLVLRYSSEPNTTPVLNILLVRALNDRLHRKPIIVNSANPGFCKTGLRRNLPGMALFMMWLMDMTMGRTADDGSRVFVWAALGGEEKRDELRGAYVDLCRVKEPSDYVISEDGNAAQDKIWVCVIFCVIYLTFRTYGGIPGRLDWRAGQDWTKGPANCEGMPHRTGSQLTSKEQPWWRCRWRRDKASKFARRHGGVISTTISPYVGTPQASGPDQSLRDQHRKLVVQNHMISVSMTLSYRITSQVPIQSKQFFDIKTTSKSCTKRPT